MKSSFQGVCERPFEATCQRLEELIALLSRFNADFVSGTGREVLFDRLLAGIMTHTDSLYGFIGECLEQANGEPIRVRVRALRLPGGRGESRVAVGSYGEYPVPPESFIDDLIKSGLPVISNQIAKDPRANAPLPGKPNLTGFLGVPLLIREQVAGLVALGNREGGYDRGLAVHLAPIATSMAALVEADRMAERAYYDPLTGLPNERLFMQRFNAESSRHARRRLPLSLLRLEVDHFNNYRNNHGVKAGEACIKRIAEILTGNLRTEDSIVRIDQNQFAALLSETPNVRAVVVAEKLRQAVTKAPIEVEGVAAALSPSVSIGLVTLPSEGRPYDVLMFAADQALQQAKRQGGNQVYAGAVRPT